MRIEVLISQGSIERDHLDRGFRGQQSQSATVPMNIRVLKDTVSLILDSGPPQNCNFLGISFWEKKKARPRAVKRFARPPCRRDWQLNKDGKARGAVTHWPYLLAMCYSGPLNVNLNLTLGPEDGPEGRGAAEFLCSFQCGHTRESPFPTFNH